jgi:hypothetical protein
MMAFELLGVGIAPRHHRGALGDAQIGLPQLHPVLFFGQLDDPSDRRMQQLGVGKTEAEGKNPKQWTTQVATQALSSIELSPRLVRCGQQSNIASSGSLPEGDTSEAMPAISEDLAGNATLPATGNIAIASAIKRDNVMRPMRMAVCLRRTIRFHSFEGQMTILRAYRSDLPNTMSVRTGSPQPAVLTVELSGPTISIGKVGQSSRP